MSDFSPDAGDLTPDRSLSGRTDFVSDAIVEEFLRGYEFLHDIGLEYRSCRHGAVSFQFSPPPVFRNPSSALVGGAGIHGGILATVLDTAGCFAVTTVNGIDVGTIGLSVDYLRPALDASFHVDGSVIRVGRKIAWSESAVRDTEDRLIAVARVTTIW